MSKAKFLEYGFVAESEGRLIYDDKIRASLNYPGELLDTLKSPATPALAKQHPYFGYQLARTNAHCPVFAYRDSQHGPEAFLSAYYLVDTLTKQHVLPVYIAETGEVKDLMPLLNHKQKQDASVVIHILRARYIKPDARHRAALTLAQAS